MLQYLDTNSLKYLLLFIISICDYPLIFSIDFEIGGLSVSFIPNFFHRKTANNWQFFFINNRSLCTVTLIITIYITSFGPGSFQSYFQGRSIEIFRYIIDLIRLRSLSTVFHML